MGYNAIIAVRNSDLDMIAADPKFGHAVYELITGADHECRKKKQSGAERGWVGPVKLSDMGDHRESADKPYEIFSTPAHHADHDQIVLVTKEGLRPMNVGDSSTVPFDAWQQMTEVCRTLGIETTLKGEYDTRKNGPAVLGTTEDKINNDWDQDTFNGAMTLVSIVMDGLGQIKDSDDFGASLAKKAKEMWMAQKSIWKIREEPEDVRSRIWLDDSIRAGNHGNPAQVMGFTPEGHTDLAVVGGNWGRIVRPTTGIKGIIKSHYASLRNQDVKMIEQQMKYAGFSVQYGDDRMSPPPNWKKDGFVDPGYVQDLELQQESPEM